MPSATTINQVCFRTLSFKQPHHLETYESVGGYSSLRKILKGELSKEAIIETLKASELRGRGGAGFPTGLKWSFMPRHQGGESYLVCNSDEGEPGTFKDRDILRFNPHQLIEGMLIAGFVLGARVGFNYIRGEFDEPIACMEAAVATAYEKNLLGKQILGTSFDFDLHNIFGAGAYICGEETALLNAIEGQKGFPRFRPPFPANHGLYGQPTNVNNTETLASIPVILEKGAEWFLKLGKPKNGGCKIFSVSGHVKKPGNYEIPLGTPFKDLLAMAGGMQADSKLKAVIPGGSSAAILPADVILSLNMDYDSLQAAGSMLGSGAVIVMNESTCMVKVLARIADFYAEESCGQCSPCREGTGWLARLIHKVEKGCAELCDLEQIERICEGMLGNTICALADAAVMPVQSGLKYFRSEFEDHIVHKGCRVTYEN